MRPVGCDLWIVKAGQAVKHALSEGRTVLTSVGMNSWEITLFYASKYKANIRLFVPIEKKTDRDSIVEEYIRQFHLKKSRVEWYFFEYDSLKKSRLVFQADRDRAIVKGADIIYPVSLRLKSNFHNLIEQCKKSENICEDFYVQYSSSTGAGKRTYDSQHINPNIDKQLSHCLIHWSRGSNSPWPGEDLFSYYKDIVKSSIDYPRQALATLLRILSEKKLRASSRHYRKNCAAVAFSSLPPSEAIHLMRWRARYREMSFEPYGLAINKNMAIRRGTRRVLYGNIEMYQYLEPEDRPYFQSIGKRGFWLPEREYRHIGDFDLETIKKRNITIIVRKPEEIKKVKSIFPGHVVSFYN